MPQTEASSSSPAASVSMASNSSGMAWQASLSLISAAFAGLPAAATLGFVWFKQTHPPGYDSDRLDLWLHGPGFGPKPPEEADELS